MPTARDAAQYILSRHGAMTSMKLQKLVYYSQAWSAVWDDDVIFDDVIEAWDNGPVVRDLWDANRGQFRVTAVPEADIGQLNAAHLATIDRVMEFYGGKDAQWLSDLTHMEAPWKDAFDQGKNAPITPEAMSIYYSSLTTNEAEPV